MKKTSLVFSNHCSKTLSKQGAILILALWTLALLTVFSISISARVRQEITFLSRLEKTYQLRDIASAGIYKARAMYLSNFKSGQQYAINDELVPAMKRIDIFNNDLAFKDVELGQGRYSVYYDGCDSVVDNPYRMYGFIDEESKININKAPRAVLKQLFIVVLGLLEEEADELAGSIINWREAGETELTGFFSDDFYSQLKDPYESKEADFQILDELYLLKGMTAERVEKLSPFVTVFGNGGVNFNTASVLVLKALGLEDGLIKKILLVHRGEDGLLGTMDDVYFSSYNVMLSALQEKAGIDENELKALTDLSNLKMIGMDSQYFGVRCAAQLTSSKEIKEIKSVFRAKDGQIVYWREI